jgi:hypothetical protein
MSRLLRGACGAARNDNVHGGAQDARPPVALSYLSNIIFCDLDIVPEVSL